MTDRSDSYRGMRLFIIGASLAIIIWGINQAQSVVVLLLVSVFLAVIGMGPVLWMEGKRVPSVAAVLIVVVAMVTLLMSIGIVVGASLTSFSDSLPFYQARIHDMLLVIRDLLAAKGITITDEVLLGYVNPAAVMNFTTGLFAALSSVFSNVVLILFLVTFILLEASSFPTKLRLVQGNPKATFPQVTKFVDDIKRYVVIKTGINLCAGILTAIWLSILGVDFPVLWGFFVFLLNFVPGIGSLVAAVPPILLALIQLGGGTAVLTAAGFLLSGIAFGSIVEPKVMGRKFGMSTLVIFLSLIFWGNLLGLVGALLCVPLTMTLKLALEASEDTRWIAILLGPEIPAVSKK